VTGEEQARFEALERRVAELERQMADSRRTAPAPPHAAPVTEPRPRETAAGEAAAPPPRPPSIAPRPTAAMAQAAPAAQPALETKVGVNWIGRIAAVTVVLALAFFFEYAFENHWITERGRVVLGLALAGAALGLGERLWRSGHRAYGPSLAAAGIAFLYLSFWAAFALYHLLPQAAAFALMAGTTAAAGLLALRYGSEAVALLGLAGGFATPLLLEGGGGAWFVLAYALLLDCGAVWIARARSWRWPAALAWAGTVLLYGAAAPARPWFAVFLAAYFAVFAAAEEWIFVLTQLLAGAALAAIWAPHATGMAGALLLTAAGLAMADRKDRASAAAGAFAGYWVAYFAWADTAGSAFARPLALVAAGFLLAPAWALWRTCVRRKPLWMPDLVALAAAAGIFFFEECRLLRGGNEGFTGLLAVSAAAVLAALARVLWRRDPNGSRLAAGTAWALVVLAVPVQFAGYRITMAWALEAAAAVWIGQRLGERRAVAAALAVFAMVAVRLAAIETFLYRSAAECEVIANARFLTFAASAAAMWAAAWWIRSGRAARILYVAGHAAMLWGLMLEAAGWAARTAAPENFRSVASTAISVVAAAYAVLLVSGGSAWRHMGSRMLGIGLIGLVVVKLYLYDVWLLAAFYRMAAFAILGVLLLVVSYVYSRRAKA